MTSQPAGPIARRDQGMGDMSSTDRIAEWTRAFARGEWDQGDPDNPVTPEMLVAEYANWSVGETGIDHEDGRICRMPPGGGGAAMPKWWYEGLVAWLVDRGHM